jgi:hypothetical protein
MFYNAFLVYTELLDVFLCNVLISSIVSGRVGSAAILEVLVSNPGFDSGHSEASDVFVNLVQANTSVVRLLCHHCFS